MTAKFFDRNKKKSLLAALLLFLRERKILVLLLLLVLMASTVFLGPSALFRLGFLAKWLGTGDRHSYGDLVAAFKAAKNKSAEGGAGWGGFFGHGGASGNGAGAGSGAPSSLDFVKGSKSDLGQAPGAGAGAGGAGGAGAGAQTVAGIANAANPKDGQSGDAVAVGDDAGGEREGLVKNAFAGGFMDGLMGSAGSGEGASGAYVGKGFFSGKGGAAGSVNDMAQAGLSGVASASTPSSVKSGVGKSSLSAMNARRAVTGSQNGFSGFSLGGKNSPYSQLAVGAANTYRVGTKCSGASCCTPPACPPEFAATNTGAIYDGSDTTAGILTAGGGGSNSGGLLNSAVTVPPAGSGGFGGDGGGGATADAQNMQTCANLVQTCAGTFTAPMEQEGKDEKQLSAWYGQMAGACGNPCNCGPCRNLNAQITGLCNGDFTTQTNLMDTPCAPLPDYCAPLGFTNVPPPANQTINCTQNMGLMRLPQLFLQSWMPARLLKSSRGVAWAALSAILLLLTAPPTGAHYLLWLAWAPLFHALDLAPSRRSAIVVGVLFGALYYGLFFRWTLALPVVAFAFAFLCGVAYGAYFGAAAYALRRLPGWARALALPLLWTAPALIADNPWFPFLNSVILLLGMHAPLPLPLLQLAHPLGEVGLAFFVVLVNALLWRAVEARGRAREAAIGGGCAAALLVGGWIWGSAQARSFSEPASGAKPFRLACAQHDLPFLWDWRAAHQDEIYRIYDEMTAQAAARGADMVLFPQYQIPEDIYRHPQRWGEIARKSGVYMALGTYAPVEPEQFGAEAWVVSLVFAPDGKMIGTHRALHPSPFGRPMVVAGTDAEPIAIPSLGRLAILPCFDDVTPRPTRMFGRSGIDFIAAIANDEAVQGNSIQPELHLIRSRLRAVESRKFLVHCTPNGISAVIDPAGRVLDSLPNGRGLLIHDFAGAKIN